MAEIDMAEFEGAGERYKFLLQPVKDLAANWDLDIAKTLEDYIRKVVEETNRTDADTSTDEHIHHKVFNFAEAALLIHGTTAVYARKVEYVLQRAQNFFNQLTKDENKRTEKETNDKSIANDFDDFAVEEPERRQPKVTNYASLGHLLDRLSRRQSSLLPVVPIAFFPLTDLEKRDVPLCTRTNPTEVFGKKEDFRVNSCHIHGSVALLDFKNVFIVNEFSQLAINSQKKEANFVASGPCSLLSAVEIAAGGENSANCVTPSLCPNNNNGLPFLSNTMAIILPTNLISSFCGELPDSGDITIADNEPFPDEPNNSSSTSPTHVGSEIEEERRDEEFLDPCETVSDQSRPFRRNGNCVMNALKQIKARTRRIERDCREKGVPNVSTIKCYIETRIFRHQLKKRAYTLGLFNTFIADKAVLALNPLIHEEEKRRSELRKKRRKEIQNADRAERAMRRAMQNREADPVLEQPVGNDYEQMDGEGEAEQEDFDDPMDELVAEEIINLPPDEIWDDELEQNDHQNLGDILEVEDLENSFGHVQNLYAGFEHLNTVQKKRAKSLANQHNFYDDTIFAGGDINPNDLPPRPVSQMDYDEIIAFHLHKYWTASEQATSEYSEHIQKWEKRMMSILEQEHLHREFCTSTYGDELLERFGGQIDSELDFTKMLSVLPNDYDRSRFLLVALILANMGNVQILTDEGENQHVRLRLLSLKRQEFSL